MRAGLRKAEYETLGEPMEIFPAVSATAAANALGHSASFLQRS